MQIQISDTPKELNEALAQRICDLINRTLEQQEFFTLVLSGGSTPVSLYRLLASIAWKEKVDWSRVLVFWGDERDVPFDDDRNNAKMAYAALLDHVPVMPENIFVMRTDLEPQQAAEIYHEKLHQLFDARQNTFDLVLLGMGDDGHTLSLFPGSSLLDDGESWVRAAYIDKVGMNRITLMPAVVNLARYVIFMVSGEGKAPTLKQVLEGDNDPRRLPSQLIKPSKGELWWYLDSAAARDLDRK